MCVTIVSYEVCLNGMSVGPISPTRGLRQGDPLSPYLFLFCVEGLSNFLNNAAASGLIDGYRVSQLAPDITHPFFLLMIAFCSLELQEKKLSKLRFCWVCTKSFQGDRLTFRNQGFFIVQILDVTNSWNCLQS